MAKFYVLPDPTPEVPDWQPAVIAGEPQMMINRAMVLALIRDSPLGVPLACQRMNEFARADIEGGRVGPFTVAEVNGRG